MATFVYPALQIDTTGLATEAKQDLMITELTDINTELDSQTALLTTIDADTSSIATDSSTTATNTTTIAGDTTSIDSKITPNSIDPNNSTSTPLGISGVFTGIGTDVSKHAAVSIQLHADQDSALDGMQFQFSTDNTNWDESNDFNMDVSSSTTRRFQFPVTAQYFRVVYTNGGVAQTSFRIQTILHDSNILTSIHRVDGSLTNDRSVTVTKSVIAGETTAGGGSFVNVKVNPSGSLTTEPTQATHDDLNVNANIQVADTDVSNGNPVPVSDAGGSLTIDATSLPLPTGAATETTLATVAGDTTSLDSKVTACNTGAVTISTALPAGTNNIGDVDIASPLPAGTNNIGDVDIASALPAGSNTIGNVNINAITPQDFLDSGLVDAGTTAITVAGLQVVASLAADITEIEIQEDIGEYMALTDGADVVLAYLPLGGGRIKVSIASGTTLKLASLTGSSITLGQIAMNLLG